MTKQPRFAAFAPIPKGKARAASFRPPLRTGSQGRRSGRVAADPYPPPRPSSEGGLVDLAVNELVLAYLKFADGYYRTNDRPTKKPVNLRLAVRPLLKLYGHTSARDFGLLGLKAVRQAMIEAGICRLEVNRRIGRIVRAFK